MKNGANMTLMITQIILVTITNFLQNDTRSVESVGLAVNFSLHENRNAYYHFIFLSKSRFDRKSKLSDFIRLKKVHYNFRLIEEEFIFLPKIINLPQQL